MPIPTEHLNQFVTPQPGAFGGYVIDEAGTVIQVVTDTAEKYNAAMSRIHVAFAGELT